MRGSVPKKVCILERFFELQSYLLFRFASHKQPTPTKKELRQGCRSTAETPPCRILWVYIFVLGIKRISIRSSIIYFPQSTG